VFDDQGNRLTPTHSKKGARRYRYYVSNSLIEAGRESSPDALRLPASELEDATLQALTSFLMGESRLIGLMGSIEAGRCTADCSMPLDWPNGYLQPNLWTGSK